MPNSSSRSWPMPTTGGSGGTWGAELNTLVDDHIEADMDAVEATADAALPKAGGVMTGELEVKTEVFPVEALGNISGAITFDLNTSNIKTATVNGDITGITFSNWPATGKAEFFTLELTNGGAHAISWPSAVKWDGDAEPSLQASGVDFLVFVSLDGGTTIRAMHSGAFAS